MILKANRLPCRCWIVLDGDAVPSQIYADVECRLAFLGQKGTPMRSRRSTERRVGKRKLLVSTEAPYVDRNCIRRACDDDEQWCRQLVWARVTKWTGLYVCCIVNLRIGVLYCREK